MKTRTCILISIIVLSCLLNAAAPSTYGQAASVTRVRFARSQSSVTINSYLSRNRIYPIYVVSAKGGDQLYVRISAQWGGGIRLPFIINNPSGKPIAANENYDVNVAIRESGNYRIAIDSQSWLYKELQNGVRVPFELFIRINPTSGGVKQAASNPSRSWDAFWSRFSAAIRNKNRAAIKSMASSRFDLPNIDNTVSGWIRNLDRNNLWSLVQNSVNKGTTSCDSVDGRPCRCTRDNHLYFVFENGRWRFSGVGGV